MDKIQIVTHDTIAEKAVAILKKYNISYSDLYVRSEKHYKNYPEKKEQAISIMCKLLSPGKSSIHPFIVTKDYTDASNALSHFEALIRAEYGYIEKMNDAFEPFN